MDIVQKYVHEVTVQMQQELEQTIINFLRKEGYEVSDYPSPQEVRELMKAIEANGKRLRVEVFTKFSGKLSYTTAILPFFEPLDGKEISRVEIYKMLNLASQGYQI